MAGESRRGDLRAQLDKRLSEPKTTPFIGHPLLPISLRGKTSRTERVSAYVELDLVKFLEEYQARGGFRGLSEVVRRLVILGAEREGYLFNGRDKE